MSLEASWAWPALFLLGAYHGINPGMGWLFAVALGMQERSGRAVGRSLVPLGLGHGLSVAALVSVVGLAGTVLPFATLKVGVAVILSAFGLFYLTRKRHPGWGGMQVGFGELTFWSFLMASAHGAGLMVLPILFGLRSSGSTVPEHHVHLAVAGGPWNGLWAVLVHTGGYLVITGLVAWVVYRKLGLALLRKAWVNLDLLWGAALLATGFLTLVL